MLFADFHNTASYGDTHFNGTAKARQKYGGDREFSAILNDVLENDYKSVWKNASGE